MSSGKNKKTIKQGKVQVKATRTRSESSRQWLQRQLNDPYVKKAQVDGYRARAAYKLLQLNEQFNLLKPGMRVVDLGAAPGSWCQIAAKIVGEKGQVIGLDLLPIEPMSGVLTIEGDFLSEDVYEQLKAALTGPVDVVLSDMAANSSGMPSVDHIRIIALAEAALEFACDHLKNGGTFICKLLQGGAQEELKDTLKKSFTKIRYVKPAASRAESAEVYLVATGFKTNS